MKRIVCFGDSNTFGYRAADFGRYSEEVRWPMRLQEKLGREYRIIEEGLCGRTTCFEDPLQEGLSGVSYIRPCLLSHKPISLLILMLGTNDTKERFCADAACIALGLKRLVEKAMQTECWAGGKPNILIVVPKNIEKEYESCFAVHGLGRGCAEKSQGLAEEYRKIADWFGCHYLDANEFVTKTDREDYVHLCAEGHFQMAEGVLEKIRSIFSAGQSAFPMEE